MPKIRVLVVDDAVVIRKILTDAISADSDLEVIGTAPNGKIAIQKLPQLNPDVITLDVEMPELNGIETLKEIRKTHPKTPVIMFSTLTEKGAGITLDALAAGASDYVAKPANVGNVTASRAMVQEELIRKIKGLAISAGIFPPSMKVSPSFKLSTPSSTPKVKSFLDLVSKTQIQAVTIGVSTGGPNALAELVPALPADLNVPVLIVQHMPQMFTKLLADRLNTQTKLRVVEATANEEVKPGVIYIAPGDYHMEVKRSGGKIVINLHQGPQENSCRPAVDVLFRSVANIYGKETLAVILTGMGSDGLHGCEVIKEHGGQIIAQDKETSVVWGMPSYVVEANLSDAVLPLSSIAPEISRRVLKGRTRISSPST